MADAKEKKTRKASGPRVAKPLYLIVEGPSPVIVGVTKDPLAIVNALQGGREVSFVDLNTYLPKKAVKA